MDVNSTQQLPDIALNTKGVPFVIRHDNGEKTAQLLQLVNTSIWN